MRRFRFWLIKKIFTEDEKYFLMRAIENRCDELKMDVIFQKTSDKENNLKDVAYYLNFKNIFSTPEWK